MPTTRRLDGLDAARGLAVVSMLVAHLCPVGGVFNVSEYLTAPLFAVIIGISMGVQLTERRPPGVVPARQPQRGLVLIVLGVLLQAIYAQIDVVLPYLGVLVIVLAPLALLLHRVPVLTVGIAGALAVVGPIVVERAREAYPSMARPGRTGRSTWSPGWPPVSLPAGLVPADGPGRAGPRPPCCAVPSARPRGTSSPGALLVLGRRGLRPRPGHHRRLGRLLGHDGRGGRRDVPGERDGRRELPRRGPAAPGRVRRACSSRCWRPAGSP